MRIVHKRDSRLALCAAVVFWGAFPLAASSGCGKGNSSRFAEFSLPPKPTKQQITAVRQEMREPEPPETPATPLPTLPALELPMFKEWGVRETAADALARIGPTAVPALIEALRDPSADVRDRAAQALARMGPPAKEAVPSLILALKDSDWHVRRSAARALGQIGADAQQAIPALIDVIRNPASDRGEKKEAAKS